MDQRAFRVFVSFMLIRTTFPMFKPLSLEQSPPIPMLQSGANPLHTFLGFDTRKHIVSLCLRDPMDTREMPPNGNTHISANCVRGVRKVGQLLSLQSCVYYIYSSQ